MCHSQLFRLSFAEGSRLRSIGDEACKRFEYLSTVVLPAALVTIGKQAFSYCEKLASVEFGAGSGLREVGERAFEYCKALKTIALPSSVETIGAKAFMWCTSLADVTLGANSQLRYIGEAAFKSTPALRRFSPLPPGVVTEDGAFDESGLGTSPEDDVPLPQNVGAVCPNCGHSGEFVERDGISVWRCPVSLAVLPCMLPPPLVCFWWCLIWDNSCWKVPGMRCPCCKESITRERWERMCQTGSEVRV